MNDLDKRIADLKGLSIEILTEDGSGPTMLLVQIEPGSTSYDGAEPWSRSDSKALELVDEWCALKKGNAAWISTESVIARVQFIRDHSPHTGGIQVSSAFEKTRPEAICRAYIDAREWMATKAGA
jgi:hypothetical protein